MFLAIGVHPYPYPTRLETSVFENSAWLRLRLRSLRPAVFLYVLSGKRQLHTYQDSETGLFRRSKFCRLLRSALGLTKEGIELSAIQEAATENYGLNLLRIMDIRQGIGS
jgi:hypothetical protein